MVTIPSPVHSVGAQTPQQWPVTCGRCNVLTKQHGTAAQCAACTRARNNVTIPPPHPAIIMEAQHRLREAVVNDNLAITKRLLARYPELWLNPDPQNRGWCNLHYASYHGNYLVCFHLISKMGGSQMRLELSDVDLVTFDNLTVLHLSIMNQFSQTLHLLLQEFSSSRWIDYRGGPLGRTPLHYCCVNNFVDGFKLLLEFGADWSLADDNGDTCLHLCFAYSSLACMEQLVRFVTEQASERQMGSSGLFKSGSVLNLRPSDSAVSDSPELSANFNLKGSSDSPHSSESKRDKEEEEEPESAFDNALRKLEPLEKALNHRKYPPSLLAGTFELQNNYETLKTSWVQKALSEHLINSPLHFYPFSSPQKVSEMFSPLTTLQNNSRVSDTSGSVGSDRADTLAEEPSLVLGKAENKGPQNYGSQNPGSQNDPEIVSSRRKHSASLPPVHIADERPLIYRRHSKSLVQGFGSRSSWSFQGGSPMQVRHPSTPHSAFFNPKSPLQVEFTRTQSRKSLSSMPQARSVSESGRDSVSDSKSSSSKDVTSDETISLSNKSQSFPVVTPPGSSKSHQFHFSSLSQSRQRSVSGSSSSVDVSRNEMVRPVESGRELGKTSSTKFNPSATLRRNSSTPAVMHSMGSMEAVHKRPMKPTSEIQKKPSFSEDPADALEKSMAADTSMESLSEEKVLTFSTPRMLSRTKFDDKSKESAKRSVNVSSISFTSIRDE